VNAPRKSMASFWSNSNFLESLLTISLMLLILID
jgi:hypothetical protein